MPKLKLIACNVFQRELCHLLARTQKIIDPEFLELGLHETPYILREALQSRIDAVSDAAPGGERYEAILLAYGLCGTGLAGIKARSIPLVLPRAHDCCTILLGSRAEFAARFGDNPSASWTSAGYIERAGSYLRVSGLGQSTGIGLEYSELVEKYGEENAAFVWETLHPELKERELRYIEIPDAPDLGYARLMRERADSEGKEFVLIPGSMRMLHDLLENPSDEDFLIVPPGGTVDSAYDNDRIVILAEQVPALPAGTPVAAPSGSGAGSDSGSGSGPSAPAESLP